MLPQFREPDASEAEANLRMIRELMERSTRHSTFSGMSGVLAGIASILGCLVTYALGRQHFSPRYYQSAFLLTWSIVIVAAIGMDYLLTKRQATQVGKHIVSRLGKQMLLAIVPGLGTGALLTLFFRQQTLIPEAFLADVFPVWMLCYGISVCSVGTFSQPEVSYLGVAFLLAGAATLLLFPHFGLAMMALTFGGFHIAYGLLVARKDGW